MRHWRHEGFDVPNGGPAGEVASGICGDGAFAFLPCHGFAAVAAEGMGRDKGVWDTASPLLLKLVSG